MVLAREEQKQFNKELLHQPDAQPCSITNAANAFISETPVYYVVVQMFYGAFTIGTWFWVISLRLPETSYQLQAK